MPWRLKHNPANGDVAIYEVPSLASTDNAPLTDPTGNLHRLQFHSGMILPSTTPELTQQATFTIPAQAANTKFFGQANLFAHGKGQPCMVEGRIMNLAGAGQHVWFNGTMPVYMHTVGGQATGFATWLALCATNTHVAVAWFGITKNDEGTRPALTLTVEATAYDFLATGSADTANPALPRIRVWPGSHIQFGRGKFDTRRRFIRRTAAGGLGAMSLTETLTIVGDAGGQYVQNSVGWRWRYSCGGYVKQTQLGWNGSATNGGTANAETILVVR